jgi:uncharacterized membrane protein
MASDQPTKWWLLLPSGFRRLPADLVAVLAVVVLVNAAVFLPVVRETPVRVVVGLPFVLFVPGYALIAALFPEAGGSDAVEDTADATAEASTGESTDTAGALDSGGIDGIERVALSFGLSIAVVPLIGLVLNFTPWGIRLIPIMVATSAFTVGATWVGARRRFALSAEDRFAVPYRTWTASARTELLEPDSRADLALNVLLVVSILLAVTSVTYAVAVPKEGESFSEFYLLTEDDSGELVADGYPTELVAGEGRELIVGIGNNEFRRVNYTVVVELQQVAFETSQRDVTPRANATRDGQNVTSVSVVEEDEIGRFRTALGHNRTYQESYEVRPTLTGDEMRLAFLLYREEPPQEPTVENAYRETHLWVNVSQPAANG